MSSGWWQSTALAWENPARTQNRSEPKLQVLFDFGLSPHADLITPTSLYLFIYWLGSLWYSDLLFAFMWNPWIVHVWAIFTCFSIPSLQSLISCSCSDPDHKTLMSVFEMLSQMIQSFGLNHKRTGFRFGLACLHAADAPSLMCYAVIVLLLSKEC